MGKVQGEGWECWDRAVQVAGAGVGAFQAEGTANKGLRLANAVPTTERMKAGNSGPSTEQLKGIIHRLPLPRSPLHAGVA